MKRYIPPTNAQYYLEDGYYYRIYTDENGQYIETEEPIKVPSQQTEPPMPPQMYNKKP